MTHFLWSARNYQPSSRAHCEFPFHHWVSLCHITTTHSFQAPPPMVPSHPPLPGSTSGFVYPTCYIKTLLSIQKRLKWRQVKYSWYRIRYMYFSNLPLHMHDVGLQEFQTCFCFVFVFSQMRCVPCVTFTLLSAMRYDAHRSSNRQPPTCVLCCVQPTSCNTNDDHVIAIECHTHARDPAPAARRPWPWPD